MLGLDSRSHHWAATAASPDAGSRPSSSAAFGGRSRPRCIAGIYMLVLDSSCYSRAP